MGEYWVYENRTMRQGTVHNGACGDCQHGKGKQRAITTEHGRWHGPYDSVGAANTAALHTVQMVRRCRHCQPT